MTALRDSAALHERVRAWVGAFERGAAMPESFDALARDIARFQAQTVPGYARLCAARGIEPTAIAHAVDAPAVPTEAFKLAHVSAFAPHDATHLFRTSGTTTGDRGAHPVRDVATYDRGALAFGRKMLAARLPPASPVLVIGPSAREAPDSSLAHMCSVFVASFGRLEPPERTYFVRGDKLDTHGLRARVASLPSGAATLVLATSFALVHLLDAVADAVLPLPAGSRVMQTGGFKGKAREVAPDELRRAVARLFAVEERAIVGEYGMTELSSQFWEGTLIDTGASHGVYLEPPWARVIPVDPDTLAPVDAGAAGIARIEDLANVDSAFAVLTQDRVRRCGRGFELLGRAPGAPPRGCSIALDEMLALRALR